MRAMPLDLGMIHFVGIGGIGMSGIAEVLHNLGYKVQGSDIADGANTRRLQEIGIKVAIGHRADNIAHAQVVVVSSAVKKDNPEVLAARSRLLPVVRRAEMLGELMRLKWSVAIGGTHGKTTTTSMVAAMLDAGGLDPTVINGGIINAYGTNARLGGGDWMVVESDESDGSFLRLPAVIAVVTNVDPEHLDHYGTFDALRDAFVRFVENIPFYGFAVLCSDHPEVQALIPRIADRRIITYGIGANADVRAINLRLDRSGADFDVTIENRATNESRTIVDLRLPMFGQHNVQNALAAIAVAQEMGLPDETIRRALGGFAGVKRRFTKTGEAHGITVIDDYGHHPVEIAAVLRAARQAYGGSGRVIAVMQPHRYTRLACAQGRIRGLLRRRRRSPDRRRLCRGRGADRGCEPRHAGEPGAARRPSRRDGARRTGRPARPDLADGAARRRRGLPRRRQHHGVGACAARPAPADRGRAGRSALDRQRSRSRDGGMMALATRPHLIDRLPKPRGRLTADAPLGPQTWFATGGRAEVLFRPADAPDLATFLSGLPADVPVTVLGVGSNVIVRDGGIRGVVIRLLRGFTGIAVEGHEVVAGAGAPDLNVALTAREHSLAGLEFLSGIPGTIGGAFPTNAGAYGGELAEVLISAEAVDRAGRVFTVTPGELGLSYRHSKAPADWIFTSARLRAAPGDQLAITRRINEIDTTRADSQPRSRTGGSTFANPPGHKAWELIDAAGCRGLKIGGAQVSEKHTNFLINLGAATASDIEKLGEEVRRRVFDKSGVRLEWEIRRLGEFQ